MMEFKSFGAFAEHLLTREVALHEVLHVALDIAASKIEKTAKDEIGIYQPEVGPFPAWAELAEFTVQDRLAQHYSPDEPLLRDGTLRDSISYEVDGLVAVVGSTSDIAVYQEMGTVKIPPRPFLGPAAFHDEKFVLETIGAAAAAALGGEERVFLSHAYSLKGQ
jgi:HK97 gp10 family phage protein